MPAACPCSMSRWRGGDTGDGTRSGLRAPRRAHRPPVLTALLGQTIHAAPPQREAPLHSRASRSADGPQTYPCASIVPHRTAACRDAVFAPASGRHRASNITRAGTDGRARRGPTRRSVRGFVGGPAPTRAWGRNPAVERANNGITERASGQIIVSPSKRAGQ